MRITAYVRPLAAMIMLAFVQPAYADSTTAGIIPGGDQQFDHFSSTTDGEPIHVQTGDLSAPISYSSPSVSVSGNPQGQPAVSASATAASDTIANGRAALAYFVFVSGPDPALSVPIFFSSNLSASAGGNTATAVAALQIEEFNASPDMSNSYLGEIYNTSVVAQTGSSIYGNSNNVALADSLMVPTGFYLGSVISAEVETQYGSTATASADPYFYIDPTFLAAHPDYTLSFSPFVGNDAPISAVPEPASWALMLLGFGAMGVRMHRRSRSRHVPQLA